MKHDPLIEMYPLVPSALDQAHRRTRDAARESVKCAVKRHAEAAPGLILAIAEGAVEGVADALHKMPRTRRGAER